MSRSSVVERRAVRGRDVRWIRRLAALLAWRRVHPNAISVAALAAAGAGAACMVSAPGRPVAVEAGLLAVAAGFVLLRMLGNVLDGLVAVEGRRGSSTGVLFNEVPDRVADAVLLVAAGYAVPGPFAWLGWPAALLALFTAYVRVFAGSLGLPQRFTGPMAKPHRMGVLVAALVLSAVEAAVAGYRGRVLVVALGVIVAGSLVTAARRLGDVHGGLVEP